MILTHVKMPPEIGRTYCDDFVGDQDFIEDYQHARVSLVMVNIDGPLFQAPNDDDAMIVHPNCVKMKCMTMLAMTTDGSAVANLALREVRLRCRLMGMRRSDAR